MLKSRFLQAARLVLPSWVLSFAVVFQFALLPVIWQSTAGKGSFVWTAGSAALMLLTAIVCRADKLHSRTLTTFVVGFLVLYLAVGTLNYAFVGERSAERHDWLLESYKIVPLGAIYYGFGVAVGGRQPLRAIAISVFVAAAYTLMNADSYSSVALWERSQKGLNVTYQYAGDAFSVAALTLLGMMSGSLALRVGLMALAAVVMFIIPSRSSAMAGIACMLLWAFFFTKHRLPAAGALVLCAFVAWNFGWLEPRALEETFHGTRFESMVTGQIDTSKLARDDFAALGRAVISEKFMTGYFGFQVDLLGSSGSYIHSALDIWAQSGLIPFGVFCAMWVWILFRVIMPRGRFSRHREKFVGLVLFSLMSWTFARHTYVGMLYFPLGVASACLAGNGGPRVRTGMAASPAVRSPLQPGQASWG